MKRTEHMVPMRDGVRLATDLYTPEGAGPWPVILERTPYGKREVSRSEISAADPTPRSREAVARAFVEAGYAVAYQDCRGRWGSEGVFEKYLADGEDGFDTCAWLVAQPECDGRIATMGLSYAAHTQAALGCLDAPGLTAQILDSGGFANSWEGGIRQGGCFELKQATWAHKQAILAPESAADPLRRAALEAEDIRAWFSAMPWKRGHSPLRAAPDYEGYLFDQWEHGAFDDFWKRCGIWAEGFHHRYARVPALHMSSWFDPYPRTATSNYAGLKARGAQSLILGPWTHGDRSVTHAGEVDFGAEATIDSWAGDWLTHRRRFFDHHLRGTPWDEPRVRVFVMGGGSGRRNATGRYEHGGRWITAADWPLPGTRFCAFHLHADGTLAEAAPRGDAAPRTWRADPLDPVPSIGGATTSLAPVMEGGAFDQVERAGWVAHRSPGLPLAARRDVLVWQTPPLAHDVTVIGPVEAEIWFASDAPDADLHLKLIDVAPPTPDDPRGFAMNLCHGALRLRYRDDPARPKPLPRETPVRVVVQLFPTANLFRAGHRIRLDIAAANFPHFDVNPQSYEPEGQGFAPRVAVHRVFGDAARASRLVLPVIA
jgi:uncharacterized protein